MIGEAGAAAVHEARPDYSVFKPDVLRYVTIEVRVMEHDVEAVRRRYNLRSWKAAAEEAVCRQAIVPMTREEALAMQGGRLGRRSRRTAQRPTDRDD